MKRIVRVAVVVLGLGAGAAWAQQEQEQGPDAGAAAVSVAQASGGADYIGVSRNEVEPRSMSFHEWTGLAAEGFSPSRGGPLDD